MNEPITWGSYFAFQFWTWAAAVLIVSIFGPLLFLLASRECKQCGRKLQRRFDQRFGKRVSFCPFHDEGSPYP